jgi:hypothetical protein
MVASLVINFTQETDWSGFPIPRIPEGRYHSARLQSNVQENMSNNILQYGEQAYGALKIKAIGIMRLCIIDCI